MKSKWFALVVVALSVAGCQFPGKHPYPALTYTYEKQTSPKPQKIYVAAIDLTDPSVTVRVSRGGPDPDGDGKWQTMLMPPTKVADREGFDIVINGDFFSHLSGKDAEGAAALKEFQGGTPALVIGPAVTDGKSWTATTKPSPSLLIDRDNRPRIEKVQDPPPADAYELIAGHDVLVKGGQNVAPPGLKPGFARGPHPRTAVGLADGGKTLLLVVVDGRKKGVAVGMSLQELADVMIRYHADDAINLDGGGSSVIAIRNPNTGKMRILNHPSDGRERSVANVLGVTLKKKSATTQPSR